MTDTEFPPLAEVSQEVRRLAAENPDFVYPSTTWCVYVEDGAGSCIMGQAFLNLGVDLETVRSWDSPGADNGPESINLVVSNHYAEDEVYKYEDWLQTVQDFQDSGNAWGLAVELADSLINQREDNGYSN